MSGDMTFDALLRSVLADRPDRAPTAVVDAALEASVNAPQRRPRIAPLDMRAWPPSAGSLTDPRVGRGIRLLLAAAVVAVAVATAVLVGSRLLNVFPRPFLVNSLVQVGELSGTFDLPILQTLADGRVLMGGGQEGAIVTVFDPRTNQALPIASGFASVALQGVAVLPDGHVFLIGWQYDEPGHAERSLAWTFDPLTNQLSAATPTLETRFDPAVAPLPGGRVLVLGGVANTESTTVRQSTEIFDPSQRTFTAGPRMDAPRYEALATTMRDGTVLIAGGYDLGPDGTARVNRSIVLFDASTGATQTVGELGHAGYTGAGNQSLEAILHLRDGRFLIFGKQIGPQLCGRHGYDPIAVQVFDPATRAVTDAAPVAHHLTTAAQLADGRIVVSGRWQVVPGGCASGNEYMASAWLGVYDPARGVVAETRDAIAGTESLALPVEHWYSGAAALPDGRALLISGDQPTDGSPATTAVQILTLANR